MTETPEDRISKTSSLCSLRLRPHIVDGLFRLLLIEHFSDANNIEDPVFSNRLFSADDKTGILIELATRYTPTRTQKRPAIVIRRNDWQTKRLGTFASRSGTTPDGHPRFTKWWHGTHTMFCVSKVGGEVEVLAAEVANYFQHFGPTICEFFTFGFFDLVAVGGPAVLEESQVHLAVPVTVRYAWEDTWILRNHKSVPLKTVTITQLYEPLSLV